ncbi:hypothetical protein, variant [Phytophthora nicotianae CJ01A1]|uniref:Uncharacterized protein n=2 Tax=Phytophthora nicotianae TaxID=4792 RepID=W2IHR6_PHYNI|nr:hypothetical protein L915_14075 [Phytophthora nicotianae]ETP09957.1 hypothetical protein F441_14308 [Phytophthora nicotianae CJ01A1]ETK80192.1 hypothetical protein, variant [Phytophthora nicotianae]ETL33600.1 hypothetical protein L916_13973 [Phytophthora nicotianae]ETL33601.1 hypothetical protein, variant [Phytophthora nicotianae]
MPQTSSSNDTDTSKTVCSLASHLQASPQSPFWLSAHRAGPLLEAPRGNALPQGQRQGYLARENPDNIGCRVASTFLGIAKQKCNCVAETLQLQQHSGFPHCTNASDKGDTWCWVYSK